MKKPVIEFVDFGFKYSAQSEPTLYNINLTIYEGEKVLICGPSGCGKSTLASCINGLIPQRYAGEKTGTLRICGEDSDKLNIFDISRNIGTVLQDSDGQFVGMTVAEDIAFALENDCVERSRMHERVVEIAQQVGVGGLLRHAPHEISGGQKQRVSLAGVMIDRVGTLLFDEPLSNLDPATGKRAIEMIDDINQGGTTVLIIEHRLEDVLHRPVDRIILMCEGRIVADLHPDELLSGDLLLRHGIREPLYLTALKYAGVSVTPDKHPADLDALALTDEDVAKVRAWYRSVPLKNRRLDTPVQLEARGVGFTYPESDKKVLEDIGFAVQKGELLSIVGRNGAGKSTFSKAICGFVTPQEGSIQLMGRDIAPMSIKERADHIGYVMQNPNQMICESMIRDEVGLGLKTRGVPQAEIDRRVDEVLKVCGLFPFRNWPISALSFGQKKRVTIASILVLDPEIIILDEPTSGQDYRHYTEIMEFLRDISRTGVTIIMVTHDMHLMLEYADRAVVFSDGRVIADETPAGVLTSPDIIQRASLKETSLYALALRCGIEDATGFVQRFIDTDREVRAHD